MLEDIDLLEGLEDLTVDGARGVDVVGGTVAAVLGRAVDAAETVDTDGLAEVDVTGDGGSADVVPSSVALDVVRFRRFGCLVVRTSRHPGEEARSRQRS